jgi:hypothetical protein
MARLARRWIAVQFGIAASSDKGAQQKRESKDDLYHGSSPAVDVRRRTVTRLRYGHYSELVDCDVTVTWQTTADHF